MLALTLKKAVDMALAPRGNDELEIAEQSLRLEQARLGQARSALLPTLSASLTEQRQRLNLETQGLQAPGLVATGSFGTFDARLALNESIVDLAALQRWQAWQHTVEAARSRLDRSRDEAAAQVAGLYLSAVRAETLTQTAQENVRMAKTLLDLAEHRLAAGKATGLDAARARSAFADERERLLSAQMEESRARLELLRVLRLDLDTVLSLEAPPSQETSAIALEQALATGFKHRRDLSAQDEREDAARLDDLAARSDGWPSLVGFANYGPTGLSPDHTINTHLEGVSLRLPLFAGGSLAARQEQSRAQWRIERTRSENLRRRIEFELRLAVESSRLAKQKRESAEEGMALAQDELAQAQRRYEAGVTSHTELSEAQARLSRARERRAEAAFAWQRSRVELWLAMGVVRPMLEQASP